MRVRRHAKLHRLVRMARELGKRDAFWVGAVVANVCREVGLSPAELRAAADRCSSMAAQLEAAPPPAPGPRIVPLPDDQVDDQVEAPDRKSRAAGD